MATIIEGLELPHGYVLYEGEADDADDLQGMFWFTYCAPLPEGGQGDPEAGSTWETEAGAREELWQHRAEELQDALRDVLAGGTLSQGQARALLS